MIVVEQVTRHYDREPVLHAVELRLAAAGLTAIIGPNGAGKSTLLSLIAGLDQPDGGQIFLDGRPLAAYTRRELATSLTMLRQRQAFNARLRVRELVLFGRYPHHQGRPGAADYAKLDEVMTYMHVTEVADRFFDQLSGGQQQRVLIAMALAQDTPYLLLDEPLNNLDIPNAVAMMKLLRRFVEDLGKRIVIVIHDVNFASCYSDEVIALKDGRVAFQGNPADLMVPKMLESIYGMPMPVQVIDDKPVSFYYLS